MELTEKQIDEIIEYVEKTQKTFDWEYGKCRQLEELIKDKIMPSFYYRLKKNKERFTQNNINKLTE